MLIAKFSRCLCWWVLSSFARCISFWFPGFISESSQCRTWTRLSLPGTCLSELPILSTCLSLWWGLSVKLTSFMPLTIQVVFSWSLWFIQLVCFFDGSEPPFQQPAQSWRSNVSVRSLSFTSSHRRLDQCLLNYGIDGHSRGFPILQTRP